jgi:hypothetical protein
MGERDPEHTGEMTSPFTLESQLPSLNTQEYNSAVKKIDVQDVNSSAVLDCENELVLGMKTAS